MTNFKKLISSVPITEEEQKYFIRICSDWALYCSAISGFDKFKVLQLLKYLVEERPKSKRLLSRCIGRFNRLNALREEHLRC